MIFVVTALEDAESEKRVKELGVNYFFKKPLNLIELAQILDENS